ncbi:MAG TPA: glycine cleavage system protein GcvH [Thermomicrobiales bacterium]|nr:glycine cleavage system protein GcvH [Thermomicrobiales bacterium]
MAVPTDRKYTRTHEWVLVDGDTATIGITDYAQNELGDITYVELPAPGDTLDKSDSFGIIESVKAASDVYMPVAGEVTETNSEAESAPELINSSPYEDAWLIRVKISDPKDLEELMDAEAYEAFLSEGGH